MHRTLAAALLAFALPSLAACELKTRDRAGAGAASEGATPAKPGAPARPMARATPVPPTALPPKPAGGAPAAQPGLPGDGCKVTLAVDGMT